MQGSAPAPVRGRLGEARRHEPVRTCVGCRRKGSKAELLRVVAVSGHAVPDPRRRQPGRGAWVHPVVDCLALAERRGALSRALRSPGRLDLGEVQEFVARRSARDAQKQG